MMLLSVVVCDFLAFVGYFAIIIACLTFVLFVVFGSVSKLFDKWACKHEWETKAISISKHDGNYHPCVFICRKCGKIKYVKK